MSKLKRGITLVVRRGGDKATIHNPPLVPSIGDWVVFPEAPKDLRATGIVRTRSVLISDDGSTLVHLDIE